MTTPNILTETNNLADNSLSGRVRDEYFASFASELRLMSESYVPSGEVAKHSTFARLGLTDVGIEMLAGREYLVVTNDLDLMFISKGSGWAS